MSDQMPNLIMDNFTEDQRIALSSLRTELQPDIYIWTNFPDARYTSPRENFSITLFEPRGKGFNILIDSASAEYLDVKCGAPLALIKLRSLDLEKEELEEDLVEYLRLRLEVEHGHRDGVGDGDDDGVENGEAGANTDAGSASQISVYIGRRYDYILVSAGSEDDVLKELADLRRMCEDELDREGRWSNEKLEASEASSVDDESDKDQEAAHSHDEDNAGDRVDTNDTEAETEHEAEDDQS